MNNPVGLSSGQGAGKPNPVRLGNDVNPSDDATPQSSPEGAVGGTPFSQGDKGTDTPVSDAAPVVYYSGSGYGGARH